MSTVLEILEKTDSTAAQQRREAAEAYGAILRRDLDGKLTPGDGAKLAKVMQTLGLSAGDVRADRAALVNLDAAKAAIPTAEQIAEWNAIDLRLKEEGEAEETRHLAEVERMNLAGFANTARQRNGADAQRKAAEMEARIRSERPRVFGVTEE